MLKGFLLRGLALAAIAASVAALVLWRDVEAKTREISTLRDQLTVANSTTAALTILAQRRPQAETEFADVMAAINAAGERTSDACLADPRIRAFYDGYGVRDAARRSPP